MKTRTILTLLFVVASFLAFAARSHADTAIGNGASGCQFYPTLAVGTGGNQCTVPDAVYATPFPLVATPMPMATASIQVSIPGSRTTPIMFPDPSKSFIGLICEPVLIGANFFPGCATWNMQTGAVGTVTLINAHGSGTNAHNDPGGGYLAGGSKFIVLANAITGDASDGCMTGTGLQGSSEHCLGINIGNATSGGVALTDITAAGSFLHLPVQGISEASCFGWGGPVPAIPTNTIAPWTLCLGQEQFNNPAQSGAATYIVLHPTYSDNGVTMTHLYADTINGAGGLTTQDVLTTANTSYFSGGQQVALDVHSDVVLAGTIAESGSGTGSLTANIGAQGGGPGWSCTWNSTTLTGTVATDNAAYAAAWNSGATTGPGCSTVQNVIQAQVVNNTFACPAGVGSCIYWVRVSGYPTGTNSCSSTGVITSCTGTNAATRTCGGNYCQMQWPTIRSVGDGRLALIIANMSGASSASGGPTGPEQYALNYAIFLTHGPVNGVIRWYDITDGKDGWFEDVSPATSIISLVPALLGGGHVDAGHQCTGWPNCTGTVTEYTSDTTTATVPAYVLNATSGNRPATMGKFTFDYANATYSSTVSNWGGADRVDLVQNPADGNWDFFYSCPDTSAHLQLCGSIIDGTTGATDFSTFLESGFTVSNSPYTDISAVVHADGQLRVLASNGGLNTPGCSHPCTNQFSSDHTMASWSRSLLFGSVGTPTNGNVWSSVGDELGRQVVKVTIGPDITSNIGPACGGTGACRLYPMSFMP